MQKIRILGGTDPGFSIVVSSVPGNYEQYQISERPYSDIARFLNAELRGKGTLIDLGANIGTIALPVATKGSAVVAVEMLPQNCLKLTLSALVNGLPRFRVVQAAVNSEDGLISYSGDEAWGVVGGNSGPRAVALRLDTILADIVRDTPEFLAPPFALKIDVEGHELQALRGANAFISSVRPIIVFESIATGAPDDTTLECKQFLEHHGYTLFMLHGRTLVPKQPADLQEELVADYVGVPKERLQVFLENLVGFEARQPTIEERMAWLRILIGETDLHRRHAARVIEALSADDSTFATASTELRLLLSQKK